MKRFLSSPNFLIGLILCSAVLTMAGTSLLWTPCKVNLMDPAHRLLSPSLSHLFGTDQYGRDILSRVMAGSVNSIAVGLVTVAIGFSIGVSLGLLAAFCGKAVDEITMRLCDILFGFPAVLTAVLITAIFRPSITNAMIAIGIFYIPVFARLTRASARTVLEKEFILAARACGISEPGIAIKHIMPNILSPLLIQATIQFSVALLAEAGLSYLGLGTQPPNPSLGRMLNEAQTFLATAPWMALFPGAAIACAVLGFNLLGDGLRDILDPKLETYRFA